VKDGILCHVPALMREVKEMHAKERTTRSRAMTSALP
jgi:hypothetical protein